MDPKKFKWIQKIFKSEHKKFIYSIYRNLKAFV